MNRWLPPPSTARVSQSAGSSVAECSRTELATSRISARILLVAFVASVLAAICGTLAARYVSNSDGTTTSTGLVVAGDVNAQINPPNRSSPIDHVFQLTNPTSQSIVIKDVQTSCSCVTTKLQNYEIPPGGSVQLAVHMQFPDAYKPTFREPVQVITDAGDIELSILGRLPLPDSVRYRPTDLYLDPVPGSRVVEREVFLRIPKQCARQLSTSDLIWSGGAGVDFTLSELKASELYNEYSIRLVVSAERAKTVEGEIKLDSGCGSVSIKVHRAARSTR